MKMIRVKAFLTASVLATGALFGPQTAQAQTLSDAMVAAYETSGLLEQNRAVLRAADEDVAQAVAALRPVLNYALTAGYTSQLDSWAAGLDLTASITVYDFGASRLAIDMAQEAVLASRERLVGIEQNVLFNAVSAYLDVRAAEAVVGLRASNVRLIMQELRAARDRFEVGEITRTDVSLAEARLAAAQAAEAAAQGDLAVAREFYRSVVGAYPGQLAPPPTPPATADSLDAAKAVANRRHPDILAAQRDVTLAEISIARAKAAMMPRVTANAGMNLTDDGSAENFGLRLGGPIYQGGALRSLERQAAARRDASRAGLLLSVQNVERNVGNAWAQLRVATASLAATAQQVQASREAFAGVQEEARLGARTTLDVLDAEQALLDAQVSAISAEIGRYRSVYALLSAMGLLTVEHLGLAVPTYDPSLYYNQVRNAPLGGVSPQGERLDRILRSMGRE